MMPLRLLRVYHSSPHIKDFLKDVPVVDIIEEKRGKNNVTDIILSAEDADAVIEKLQKHLSKEKYRMLIIPVEATVPRMEEEEKEEEKEEKKERRSIEEIYQDITESASLSKTYITLVILASIVAAIGILYNDVAIVIGSMVIAPLLNPNIALALSTTLAESNLAKRAVITSIIGYAIAFFIGIIFGMFMKEEANAYHVISRSNITLMYILLALSAGIAGSLSVTKGVPQALVGVMVAVALLPPLVTGGLLAGSMQFYHALGAILLFMVNVVCINLAGVITFIAQGITPRTWWEKRKAKKTIWKSMLIWLLLLFLIVLMILLYSNKFVISQ